MKKDTVKNGFGKFLGNSAVPAAAAFLAALYLLFLLSLEIMPALAKASRKLPVYSVETDEKKIAISFDAAWGADKTREIMDICDANGVKATFFLVGFWVEKYPEITREIHERGFEIGTHSMTHPNLPGLSEEKIASELTESVKLIENASGCKVRLFRPPFGDYDNKLISICEKLDIQAIQWDVDTLDWKGLSAAEILQRVEKYVRKGSIILCHNNSKHITQALPLIFGAMKGRGYEFVTVGNLVYRNDFTIDHTGRQFKNAR